MISLWQILFEINSLKKLLSKCSLYSFVPIIIPKLKDNKPYVPLNDKFLLLFIIILLKYIL